MEQVKLQLPTPQTPVYNLEKRLDELNHTTNIGDDERWNKFRTILNAFFDFRKPFPSAVQHTPGDSSLKHLLPLLSEKDFNVLDKIITPIILSLPKNLRDKGLQLLQNIASTIDVQEGSLQVSKQGHIVERGQELKGSNLLDLIHFSIRPRRNMKAPVGWLSFFDFLQRNNVPRELIASHHYKPVVEPTEEVEKPTARPSGPAYHLRSALLNQPGSRQDTWWIPVVQK